MLLLLPPGPLQDSSWIKGCSEEQMLCLQMDQSSSLDQPDAGLSTPADITTEAGGENSNGHFDPQCSADNQLLTEDSGTEDSGDYWREAAGRWEPDVAGGTDGQISTPSSKVESCTDHKPSPQIPPVFTCKVCGESFQRRSYLLTHTSAHLRDCGVCGKHLEHSKSLKLHLRVHRETLFHCNICGQTFTLQWNLRTHMRIHSGERPYSCSVCGKNFGRKATLVRHVHSHTGEKPFTCVRCGRGFVEKGNLTVHMRTHTGERP